MNEPDGDQEGHESRRLRRMGGLDGPVDTLDCVYLDVCVRGEMNDKTTHEIITMTAEEHSDQKNVTTERSKFVAG